MGLLTNRVFSVGVVAGAVAALGVFALAVIVVRHPLAPWLLIGAAAGASAALVLAARPLLAAHAALVLLLVPMHLRLDPVYTIAVNGCLAVGLASWGVRRILERAPPAWPAACIAAMLLVAWAALSLLWAPNIVEGRRQLVSWVISVSLLLLLVDLTRTREALDRLMLTMRLYGWFLIAAGLLTVLLGGYSFDRRLNVLGLNENGFGLYLIVMLPGVLWPSLAVGDPRRMLHVGQGVAYILCALPLIALTGSRGTAASLVLLLLALLAPRETRRWGFLGLALIGMMALLAPFLLDVVMRRWEENDMGELGNRMPIWIASLRMILDYPWTGAGIGNGPFQLRAYLASVTSDLNRRIDLPSHQPLLEIAVDIGLVGLCLYGAIVAAAAASFVRAWRKAGVSSAVPRGFFPTIAAVAGAFSLSWFKAGGFTHHVTFILLLSLLLIPGRIVAAQDPRR